MRGFGQETQIIVSELKINFNGNGKSPSPRNELGKFKPGHSGNPGGRPKVIKEAYYARLLSETTYKGEKMTEVEAIAASMVDAAKMSSEPHSVSAAKEI